MGTAQLLIKLTDMSFDSAVLLVGMRLAKSITADHPDRSDWSRVSLISQAFFEAKIEAEVPRTSFDPVPSTDGAVVRLIRKDASSGWARDALTRSYLAIFEANSTHSTAAKALRTITLDTKGSAESAAGLSRDKARSNRAKRRAENRVLKDLTAEFNQGSSKGQRTERF